MFILIINNKLFGIFSYFCSIILNRKHFSSENKGCNVTEKEFYRKSNHEKHKEKYYFCKAKQNSDEP